MNNISQNNVVENITDNKINLTLIEDTENLLSKE